MSSWLLLLRSHFLPVSQQEAPQVSPTSTTAAAALPAHLLTALCCPSSPMDQLKFPTNSLPMIPTKSCACSTFPSHFFLLFGHPGASAHQVLLSPPSCQASGTFPAMAILLCPGSILLTLCLVVSSAPLLLHGCCCFSQYPLPPAILGNFCAHFMLS